MRQLRLLRQDADGGNLVLEEALSGEQFALEVNDVLRAALRNESRETTPAAPPKRPVDASPLPISPRDIQVRVRSGASPQTIADETGVELERVLRFAGPLIAERGRIADEARRARARRSENLTVVFGEAVDERYSAHGIVPANVTWDSYRREDGEWVILASWLGGEGEHSAEWVFHRSSRTVTPVDDTAAELLSDRPIRPIAPPVRPTLTVAPPLAPGIVAFPPMPEARTGPLPTADELFDQEASLDSPRTGLPKIDTSRHRAPDFPATQFPRPVVAASGPTLPSSFAPPPDHVAPFPPFIPGAPEATDAGLRFAPPLDDDDADYETDYADDPASTVEPAAFTPSIAPFAPPTPLGPPHVTPVALDDPSIDFDEPPLPLHISADPAILARLTNLGASRREESDDERAARARIPSWNDILLGVRPRND